MAYLIQQITNDTTQTQNLILPDGTTLSISMYFVPMQYGWFITNLSVGSFILNGLRITNSPNMLYQFKNQITFGLACVSSSQREPSQQDDFSSGASSLYILTSDEVELYSEFLSNG